MCVVFVQGSDGFGFVVGQYFGVYILDVQCGGYLLCGVLVVVIEYGGVDVQCMQGGDGLLCIGFDFVVEGQQVQDVYMVCFMFGQLGQCVVLGL